jgi:predicted N-acetyltransferase YhbS
MINVDIRPETESDFAAIYEVNRLAFGQASEANLVELLRSGDSFIPELSLVATFEQKIVGHILFTKIKIINEDGSEYESLALAPMAVVPDLQKQGIGGQLIVSGLAKARALGFASVIVLGHEHYYPKFGFVPAKRWNIQSPFEVPSDVFMAIELVEDGLKGVSGTVVYPKAFEMV